MLFKVKIKATHRTKKTFTACIALQQQCAQTTRFTNTDGVHCVFLIALSSICPLD